MNDAQLKTAIGSLNHADDSQWTQEGKPRPEAVTAAMAQPGVDATAEEIARVAPNYRRASRDELAADAVAAAARPDDEDSKPEASADPRIKTEASPKGLEAVKPATVAEALALKALLDDEYVGIERQLSTLTARKNVINKERDKLLPVLEPQAGNTLAHTIQAYQARSKQTQAARVGQIAAVNLALGGQLGHSIAGAPSPLDASRQVNRAHGSQLKPQPTVVIKPVEPVAKAS